MPSVPSLPGAAVRRAGVLAVLALLLTALGASPAAAHNALRSTDPADGATVATAPAQVTLTFDQPAMELGTQVVVTGPDGAVLSTGAVQLVDASVVQPLVADLPAGTYTVDWRVTSADGHPLSGAFAFTAAAGSGGTAPTADAEPAPTAIADEASTTPTVEASPTADAADTSTVTAVPTPAAPPSDDPGTWVWVAVGVGALAVLAAGVTAAVVARRRAPDGAPGADAGPGPTTTV